MELEGADSAVQNVKKLLDVFRSNSDKIVHIQHISNRPNATFFLPNTKGVEIHDLIKPVDGEAVFQKNFPNSFRETGLLEYLNKNNIDELVVTGMMTHMCVDTTTREAFDLGLKCTLAYDACATRNLSFNSKEVKAEDVQTAYMAALNGLFAKVISTDEIIAEIR